MSSGTPPGDLEVFVAPDGLEIVNSTTNEVSLVVPHDQVSDLIHKLAAAHGEVLVATVRDIRAADPGEPPRC